MVLPLDVIDVKVTQGDVVKICSLFDLNPTHEYLIVYKGFAHSCA
jgi:hypothetical protein